MQYRLKKGVVLFRMCGEQFIFPSREAGGLLPIILSVSQELTSVLCSGEEIDERTLSEATKGKLERLTAAGFFEEC